MTHAVHDRVALELARLVAEQVCARPECVALARANLRRWRDRNAGAAALVRCYDEWLGLLDRPVPEVCQAMLAPTSQGQRLRQNSPFAGVLPADVVWRVKRKARDGQAAA